MSAATADWDKIADKALCWIEDAFVRVYKARSDAGDAERKVTFAASYCLLAVHEYMESAFLAMKARHYHAGLACCLPAIEMAVTFYWCTYDVDDFLARLQQWEAADADEWDVRMREMARADLPIGLPEETPEKLPHRQLDPPPANGEPLPDVKAMLEELDRRVGHDGRFTYLYPTLYRPICASAHSRWAPQRYFQVGGPGVARRKTPQQPPDAVWVVLTVCLALIGSIYHFFGWDVSPVKSEYTELIRSEGESGPPGE